MLDLVSAIRDLIRQHWGERIKGEHNGVIRVESEKLFNPEVLDIGDIVRKLEDEERCEPFTVGEWDYFIMNMDESEALSSHGRM